MKGFCNARIFVHGKGIVHSDLAFGEKIAGFFPPSEPIDLPSDAIVLPGFIDEHIHGLSGVDVRDADTYSALCTMSRELPKEGTTSFLATEASQLSPRLLSAMKDVRRYLEEKKEEKGGKIGATLLGVHLEGPFLAPSRCGGILSEALTPPSVELFERLNEVSGGNIRLLTLAPELPGSSEVIRHLRKLGIVVSVGHSEATETELCKAVSEGATCVTHLFNALPPMHHREVGIVGGALLNDSLFCELIADLVHVSVPALKIVLRCKPKDKIILITDSIAFKGRSGDGSFEADGRTISVKDGKVTLSDGTIAGSILPMNIAVKNMIEKVGTPFLDAVNFASLNPARSLGIDGERGSIGIGKNADLVVVDGNINVICTVCNGRIAYMAPRDGKRIKTEKAFR